MGAGEEVVEAPALPRCKGGEAACTFGCFGWSIAMGWVASSGC